MQGGDTAYMDKQRPPLRDKYAHAADTEMSYRDSDPRTETSETNPVYKSQAL